jgi:hypothetical protein
VKVKSGFYQWTYWKIISRNLSPIIIKKEVFFKRTYTLLEELWSTIVVEYDEIAPL